MKTGCIAILTLAIGTLDMILVQATECTDKELEEISNLYTSALMDDTAACPDMTTATDVDYCSLADCLDFLSTMVDELPDCTSGGANLNLKDALQLTLDYCETGTADTTGLLADTSSSTAEATDSTSSSVFRTESSGPATSTTGPTSDRVTANTIPPATDGSSSASSLGNAVSTAAFAVTAFVVAICV